MSPKARFQIMLDPEQLEALRNRQDETGVTIAEQIRRAINAALPEVALKKPTRKASKKR